MGFLRRVKIRWKSISNPPLHQGRKKERYCSPQRAPRRGSPRSCLGALMNPGIFCFFWWIKHDSLPPYLYKVEWIQGNVLGNVNLGEYLKAASRSQKWHRKRIALLIVCVNTFWILLVSWWTNILIAHVFENDDILVLGNAINFCN